ncbi:18180_t:CDS:2, partial [Dentiscutata erythropus]
MSTQPLNQENSEQAIQSHLLKVYGSFCLVIAFGVIIFRTLDFIFELPIRPLIEVLFLYEDVANVYKMNFLMFGPVVLLPLATNKKIIIDVSKYRSLLLLETVTNPYHSDERPTIYLDILKLCEN